MSPIRCRVGLLAFVYVVFVYESELVCVARILYVTSRHLVNVHKDLYGCQSFVHLVDPGCHQRLSVYLTAVFT